MIIAETPRLRLRLLEQADAPFVLALYTDTDFRANIGDRGVHDLASAARYIIDGPGACFAQFGFCLYCVERKADGRAVGMCGLLRRDSHPDVEIGFAMLPEGRGQGYAREAAAATLQLATGSLGLKRIVALTVPDNTRSISLLERIGFSFDRMVSFTTEGTSRLFIFERADTSAA
jgi:[ribosomal protein S5]-alanine N-acetyltransferase